MKKWILIFIILISSYLLLNNNVLNLNQNSNFTIGQAIDSLNGVIVFYNGSIDNVSGRNVKNGYNIGLKYQCVEFVKRYYFEYFEHRMPDSYGHAKSFYDPTIADGKVNKLRGLKQFANPNKSKPKESDLLVMDGTIYNPYGHVAIISKVTKNEVEIIQQNPGRHSSSRNKIRLAKTFDGKWEIENKNILGWLRK